VPAIPARLRIRYAFVADCAMPAVSIRTPAPIVLETLTLRR
jgi:hypothetical protein